MFGSMERDHHFFKLKHHYNSHYKKACLYVDEKYVKVKRFIKEYIQLGPYFLLAYPLVVLPSVCCSPFVLSSSLSTYVEAEEVKL